MMASEPGTTIGILVAMLIILSGLLVFLYRRLNRDTNDQYTVRNIVLGEGGLRDRVRSGVITVERTLGVQLWPRPRSDEDEDEDEDEDRQRPTNGDVETGQNQTDKRSEDVTAEDQDEHGDEEDDDDDDDDYSSMDGADLRERAKLMKDDEKEDDQQEGERRKGGGEKEEDGEKEVCGLLVNLQELSGSAIWSEEKKKDEEEDTDLTAL